MRLRAADGRPAPDDLEVSWVPDQEDPEESELLEPDVIDQEEVCPICGYPYPCHWERGGMRRHPVRSTKTACSSSNRAAIDTESVNSADRAGSS